MTLRKAAQQALEALENPQLGKWTEAITALRAALAEPAEPVAWIEHGLLEADDGLVWKKGSVGRYTPLYTAPTPRKPLTDEEIAKCNEKVQVLRHITLGYLIKFARAIEAAHGITGDK